MTDDWLERERFEHISTRGFVWLLLRSREKGIVWLCVKKSIQFKNMN